MKNTARTTVREGRQSSDNTYVRIAAAEQNCLQAAMIKHSDPCRKFSSGVAGEESALNLNFSTLWNCQTRVELEAHIRSAINLISTKPTVADMTLPGGWYRGPNKSHNPHISEYIFCKVKFNSMGYLFCFRFIGYLWISISK